jgi:hypothetical protein
MNHTVQDRKMIVNPTGAPNRLLRRQLGTVSKGGFPHPEPCADGRHIILIDKFLKLMGLQVILSNEKGQI